MGLYESNFIRFGWLAGKLTALAGRYRSAVRGDCDLVLTVTERSRTSSQHASSSRPRYAPPQQRLTVNRGPLPRSTNARHW